MHLLGWNIKIRDLLLTANFITSIFISGPLHSDDFPSDYIENQIQAAREVINVNTELLESGQLLKINYVGRPIFIYRRTDGEISYLDNKNKFNLADPASKNLYASIKYSYQSSSSYVWTRLLLTDQPEIEEFPYRSFEKELFVVAGWGPQSGCELLFNLPDIKDKLDTTFFDPCVGASYDTSGRVLEGKLKNGSHGYSAIYNLYIPPHKIMSGNLVKIGVPEHVDIPELPESFKKSYKGLNPTERLMLAAQFNDIAEVESALSDGADANFYEFGKGSPFDAAIVGGSMKIIELLISNGAKPNHNSLNVANFVGRSNVESLILELEQNEN